MRTRFMTSKSGLIKVIIFITILLLLGLIGYLSLVNQRLRPEMIIVSLIAGLIIFLMTWIWVGTYYLVNNDKLVAACGPFIWRINIADINYIRLNQNTLGGMYKATLSTKGIEIKYKKRCSLMVSPIQQDKFVDRLKELNKMIEIKER